MVDSKFPNKGSPVTSGKDLSSPTKGGLGKKSGSDTRSENQDALRSDAKGEDPASDDDEPASGGGMRKEILQSLDEAQHHALALVNSSVDQVKAWKTAREIVERFQPVPWFIWRLSNFVLGQGGKVNKVSEGMLFGMKKILCTAASDPFLGGQKKILTTRGALEVLQSDVVAAVSVIHAINRKLQGKEFERIWRPILEDALLRAQIGYMVGERRRAFGAGRGMLAGYSGRIGLVILIATGTLAQAQESLELLASGRGISEVGLDLYGCEPLQVSALTLCMAGCGRDAAFGTVNYLQPPQFRKTENEEQNSWLSSFIMCEQVRLGDTSKVSDDHWNRMLFNSETDRNDLRDVSRDLVRRGNGWTWLMGSNSN